MSASDIGFAHNYTNLYEIYKPDEERWLRIAAGITDVSWNGNEEIAQDAYYDGNGMKDSEVTGGQIIGSFSGHRLYGDAAQEYICDMLLDYMNRRTDFRWTAPDGSQLKGEVTVANIVPQGGAATDKATFSFDIHFNGVPVYVPADNEGYPTSIETKNAEIEIGKTLTLPITVYPEGASETVFFSSSDEDICEVDSDGVLHGIGMGTCEILIRSAVLPTVYTISNITVN